MPRKARIDAPGALHHIICRGIERTQIFRDDLDRNHFLDRLGKILVETSTACYAWALMPNHFHLLLRTGKASITTVMRRLLTGYAASFNRRHRRHGYLFQNRYKSILCQEDPYLLELVRYIHLNPLRSGIVRSLEELDDYPYCGHRGLMGRLRNDWQDTDMVLAFFGKRLSSSRRLYGTFLAEGIALGRRPELTGGGLVRSSGGWAVLKSERKMGSHLKGDERILGDSDFVEGVLEGQNERLERRYWLKSQGYGFDKVVRQAAEHYGLGPKDILAPGKRAKRVDARSLVCYWAVRELGMEGTAVARRLGITQSAVSRAVQRGETLVREQKIQLIKKRIS